MMSHVPTLPALPTRKSPPPPVMWSSWPLREGGRHAVFVFGLIGSLSAAAWIVTLRPLLAVGVCAVVALAGWRFFVPTHFELSSQGLTCEVLGHRRRVPWRAIYGYEICPSGVFLELGGIRPRLLGGIYVPWGTHADEVLALCEHYLDGGRRAEDGGRK